MQPKVVTCKEVLFPMWHQGQSFSGGTHLSIQPSVAIHLYPLSIYPAINSYISVSTNIHHPSIIHPFVEASRKGLRRWVIVWGTAQDPWMLLMIMVMLLMIMVIVIMMMMNLKRWVTVWVRAQVAMSNSLAIPSQCNGCPKSEMATALFGDEDEVRFHNLFESQGMASEV